MSRGFSTFYRKTDLSKINVASYTTDTVGASINFGYPISETQRLGFSVGVTDTKITSGSYAVQEIATSPVLAPEIEYWFYSQQQPDGTYAAAEVLQPIDTIPPSALSPPDGEGFLDLNGNKYLNYTLTGSWLQSTLNLSLIHI